MKKPVVLAAVGVVVGVAVAFAAFTFLLGGGAKEAEASGPPAVVSVPGKLGPHITLSDRVFNLLTEPGQSPVYLKLQTVIEFETTDPRWERVLTGCGKSAHGARRAPTGTDLMVSALPSGGSAPRAVAAGGAAGDPCEAELAALLAEFDHHIGTGRALIEDAVTTIVTGHTAAEIATPQGKETLKAEIQEAVEDLIHEPHVTRVLFVNFITQ